jgi:hypothetical protein
MMDAFVLVRSRSGAAKLPRGNEPPRDDELASTNASRTRYEDRIAVCMLG